MPAAEKAAARALRGEAEGVVLKGLVGDPLIVLAPNTVDPLPPCHHSLLTPPNYAYLRLTKNYVGILRCSIRNPTYPGSAEVQQHLPHQ